MASRVLVVAAAVAGPRALRVIQALDASGIRAELAGPDPRAQLDACELLVPLLDAEGARSPALQQAIGYALARGVRVLPAVRGARDLGLLAQAERAPWPGSERSLRRLIAQAQRALPATPRAAVRSLAMSSDARWAKAIGAEAAAELAARGWMPTTIAAAREGGRAVFVGRANDPVWRRKLAGRWTYLRPRVAPFNPIDLLHVRGDAAARVYEWWILRDARPDAWMKRVYGGEAQKLSSRSKFFGVLGPVAGKRTGAGGKLIDRRLLTQRVDRTGALAGELAAIEAWLARELASFGGDRPLRARAPSV